ncbi:MAG: acetyl-CoA carboxylase biotin carboxylase subunit [Actinobacteria bacterium]|nr:acetyl-CoA carboxylase biotin carboxylase subunit [Cyanobacteriota bacterium]MCL5771536.1 acetyl-CoA carboxylase biotin carboxylase subunit [Actinomycetota bacterium]
MFKRILIANRGEIAVRIIRACRELGIESVAVYSTADADSLHVKLADKKICIGPPPASKSYLNIANIISAALVTNSDAIHPGYGFLAENHLFVEQVILNNITFIGPAPELIDLAGNKSKAIEIMRKNNIPVIPGSINNVENCEEAVRFARKIGFPVIIKAAFGGGGRGMRIASNETELKNLFPLAKVESMNAFGKDDLYIEKFINKPRHIEFQILGDNYGNIFSPGSRECSIQRRHQKLIEEAPVINLSERTADLMLKTAIKAAQALNYKNVGTFEFLVDKEENFYFIEINTRIQVEHPVTEMVTGIDLIKEQIKIAAGENISNLIKDFLQRNKNNHKSAFGHAIEFRINAEDAQNNFNPSPGKITNCFIPDGPGIRFDSFISSGSIIPPYYDSLLGKLIIWGLDREEAILRASRAFNEFKIEGIKTTIPFHLKIISNDNFKKGNISTDFIEDEKLL